MYRISAALIRGCWLALLVPLVALAKPEALAGSWAVIAQGRPILVLQIDVKQNPASATGSLARPYKFEVSQRLVFSNVQDPVKVMPLCEVRFDRERLVFAVASPSDPKTIDRFELQIVQPDLAALKLLEAPLPPFILTRVDRSTTVAARWNPDGMFAMEGHARSNEELQRLYDEDQKAREDPSKIDWVQLAAADTQRRVRLRAMLANSELRTGRDFERAAFILQQGDSADDYLLAHTLATIAASKGNQGALWIGAAALDRYLQAVGQPQIFGTQFQQKGREPWTQEPFNSSLVSDALRRELEVPSLAEQETQRKAYDAQTSAGKQ